MASKLVGAMRNMRRTHDEDDRATNLGVAALGMLFLSNIALAILGLILVIVGSKSSGKHVSAVFAHGGLNDTLFEKPDVGASVLGVLLLALSAYGMFGLWHRNKTTLMIYHVWALFMLVAVVYACSVMNIYKQSTMDMVRNYMNTYRINHNITKIGHHSRLDGHNFDTERFDRHMWMMQVAEARAAARLFLRTVASCLGATIFFLLVSLGCSAFIMGLKYTGIRIGVATNVAGTVFGMTLFVLCYYMARSTYNVPDAVSMKFDVAFYHPVEVYEPDNAHLLWETLRKAPDVIFQTVTHDYSSGRRRLLTSPSPNASSPTPSPSPPPPVNDWTAESVWVFEEGHLRVSETQYNLTFKLALTGIEGDNLDESFRDWAKSKVADFAQINATDVAVSEVVTGAEHKIGGLWAPRFLAAAAFIVSSGNLYGLFAIHRQDRILMASHFCFSLCALILLITGAAVVSSHANATSSLIAKNWHSIQNKVVGAGVEPTDAGAFARAHFKAAAALGATVVILQLASLVSTLFNFFADDTSYVLLSPGMGRSNGSTGMFRPTELDSYDEEYGKRGFLSQERLHTRRGSDGVVPLSNLATPPPSKHFSID